MLKDADLQQMHTSHKRKIIDEKNIYDDIIGSDSDLRQDAA